MQASTRKVCKSCWRATQGSSRFLSRSAARSNSSVGPLAQDAPLKTENDWTAFQNERFAEKQWIDHYSKYGSTQNRENTWQPHHSLHRPPSPGSLTLSALVASGAHFGHSTSLMNPNFVPYAYGTRSGITIIDLDHTLPMLRRAANVTRAIAAEGGTVVFIGTRPDIRGAVRKASERMGSQSYYVGEKWLPGTLTNRLHHHGKKAVQENRITPDLLVILNPLANMPAIREAALEHIPTIGIIDSNVDPRIVMYAIPGNDESTRTAELVAGMLSIAGREGAELYTEKQRRKRAEAEVMERIAQGNEAERQRRWKEHQLDA